METNQNKYLKTLIYPVIITLCLLFFVPAIKASGKESKKLYTAYNIFVWSRGGMCCLNFKGSPNKIPVGTLVKKGRVWNSYINFKPLEGKYKGYDFSIAYMSHYHKNNKLRLLERCLL